MDDLVYELCQWQIVLPKYSIEPNIFSKKWKDCQLRLIVIRNLKPLQAKQFLNQQ